MRAEHAKLLDFLWKSPQLTIPIYQRTYSWTEVECRKLWDDVMRVGRNDSIPSHFVGSVVYVQQDDPLVINQPPLLVIDGQQRLTTISLLLEALARHLGDDEAIGGFSARKLRHYYLVNPEERGDRYFKLLLTQTDRSSLIALNRQKDWPKDHSIRVKENFEFFQRKIREAQGEIDALFRGLNKLAIVDISLSRGQDQPQLIFESMNSTGKELSQADLIRNYVLMDQQPEQQTLLYEDHWRPMEVEFGQEAYGTQFDSFMRSYLTMKTGSIPNVREVYDAFKEYAPSASVEGILADVHSFAGYYCAIALGRESDRDLREAFHDIKELQVEVAYPFLLEAYQDYRFGILSPDDLIKVIRLVEAYVFRRQVCAIPTNSHGRTFATFGRSVDKENYLESVQAQFLLMPSYRRFPTDEEFKREITARNLYSFPRRGYWLRRIENAGRKERVMVEAYTIEHILPQNENLSQEWRAALGTDWQRVQQTWLHTLGNLTLTGYNSEYSDRPFREKRDMKGGFSESPLRLNEGLGSCENWDEAAIMARAQKLADQALQVWACPVLPPNVVDRYRLRPAKGGYRLSDYPLLVGPLRDLFGALRKEVLALDEGVTEEILKMYVAYKAETNFVDVIPQAKGLLLVLNMPFADIEDPRRMCKDVTRVGHHGNGDVEVTLRSPEDLSYVLGLVRQAFDRQMLSGDAP